MDFFTALPYAIGVAILAWFVVTRELWACVAGFGQLCVEAASVVSKYYFDMPRPATASRTDPGMPSSHSAWMAYDVVFAALSWRRAALLGLPTRQAAHVTCSLGVAAPLVMASRVARGEHFPTQVLAGACFGGAAALLYFLAAISPPAQAVLAFLARYSFKKSL